MNRTDILVTVAIIQVETWLSDVNDFVSDEADDMSYSVRIAALNLVMVTASSCHRYLLYVIILIPPRIPSELLQCLK